MPSPEVNVQTVGNRPPDKDGDRVMSGYSGSLATQQGTESFAHGGRWYQDYQQAPRTPQRRLSEITQPGDESETLGGDERFLIDSPGIYPFSTICALRMVRENGRISVGTGTMIGRRCVLTAGHNLFDRAKNPSGGWFQEIHVIPGLNGDLGNTPFPSVRASTFRTTNHWVQSGADAWDIGAILLPSDLGEQTGWMAFSKLTQGTLHGLAVQVAGYPLECPRLGQEGGLCRDPATTMWMHAGNIIHVEQQFLRYQVDTSGGQSGASVVAVFPNAADRFQLIGVHTEGYDWQSNRGVRISEAVWDLIVNSWLPESRPPGSA